MVNITPEKVLEMRRKPDPNELSQVDRDIIGESPSPARRRIMGNDQMTKYSESEISAARRETTVHVVDQEQFDKGAFEFGASYDDGTLDKVIASLAKIRASIPERYRAKARCGIDSASGYEGSHYGHIEVSFSRPETDEEVIARLQNADSAQAYRESQERAMLAALQAKYRNRPD